MLRPRKLLHTIRSEKSAASARLGPAGHSVAIVRVNHAPSEQHPGAPPSPAGLVLVTPFLFAVSDNKGVITPEIPVRGILGGLKGREL